MIREAEAVLLVELVDTFGIVNHENMFPLGCSRLDKDVLGCLFNFSNFKFLIFKLIRITQG